MKIKEHISIFLLIFLMLVICISSVSALENQTGDFSENKVIGVSESQEILTSSEGNYSDLSNEIGSGGNITLTKDKYSYVPGDNDTIKISISGVIDGNGAVIDMNGSDMRAFYVTTSDVTIKNLTIKNVNFYNDGGAIRFNGNGTVINCNFINNHIRSEGHGIAIKFDAEGTVTNCNFINNTAIGTATVQFDKKGIVTDCIFINNTANNGGAIRFNGEGSVTNCNFTKNHAYNNGGAIEFYDKSDITNCNFINNNADEGSAIFINGVGTTIQKCTFLNNNGFHATIFANCQSIIRNCTFLNNTGNKGGALYLNWEYIFINNCAFLNNTAKEGDAIHLMSQSSIENNWWGSNNPNWDKLLAGDYKSTPSSYALLNLSANPSVISTGEESTIVTKFIWNSTQEDATSSLPKRNVKLSSNGGSLSKTEGDVGLTSKFTADSPNPYVITATVDNQTLTIPVHVKGARYVNASAPSGGNGSEAKPFNTLNEALTAAQEGDTIMIASGEYKGIENTELTISKNLNFMRYGDSDAIFDAESQRRIWTVYASSINITGLTFKNGKAYGDNYYGGAIYFKNALSNFNINATFINNTAEDHNGYGGAIYISSGGVSGNINGTFINNTAKNMGSAIQIYGDVSGNITGIFINNTAFTGGAIHITGGVSGNINGIFIKNTATGNESTGGAIHIGDHVSGNINGIFINNTATGNESTGGAIHIGDHVSGNITGIFINNTAFTGGAIYINLIFSGKLNGIFINNTAYKGGAVSCSILIGDLSGTFINNNATIGGAIHTLTVTSSDLVIRDCQVLSAFVSNMCLNF